MAKESDGEKMPSASLGEPTVVERVLVRKDRVGQKQKEGFTVIGDGKDKHGKLLGVRTHADDLVLMEK